MVQSSFFPWGDLHIVGWTPGWEEYLDETAHSTFAFESKHDLVRACDNTNSFIQHAFDQNVLGPFPKKAKKMHFQDPFILLALIEWLKDEGMPCKVPDESRFVENIVITHYARFYPAFYIKGPGEIDLVIVKEKKFYPIEIGWSEKVRPRDLKQIVKYDNALILSNKQLASKVLDVPCHWLLEDLVKLG
jgi:hypothetical protein